MHRTAVAKVPPTTHTDIYGSALGMVPITGFDPDLVIKATATGITFLQERRYRKRYTGSKQCAVSINGELYLDSKELDAVIKADTPDDKKVTKKKQQVAPHCLNLFDVTLDDQVQISQNSEQCQKQPRKKCYSVNKKEVRQRLLGYINTQRGARELYFWTVSFPANTPDDLCYQLFNIWLTHLRKRRARSDGKGHYPPMLKDYLWVAERQEGKRLADPTKAPTNTIHFHIAIPHRMDVKRANAMMRGTLKTFAKRGELPYLPHSPQIAKYNGVDIAKNKKTGRVTNFAIKKGSRALATYMAKYVTKNNAGVPNEKGEIEVPGFTHLAWHNSRGFSALFTGVTFTLTEFKNYGFGHFLNRVRVFRMNFAIFVPWLFGPPPLLEKHLYKLNSYIQNCLDVGQQ